MIPRGKLSISVGNLFAALYYCVTSRKRSAITPNPSYGNAIFCLSVRTGLDLTLRALNLPAGTEIIVSDINIPDMFAILEAHQLKLVPISIDRQSLNVDVHEIESKITSQTKLIFITHLFGAIINMNKIVALAKKHQLILIEDCAQAFNYQYKGNPQTDVVLFSFGLIKTNTCLTGALIAFNNPFLFDQVKLLNQQLPIQPTGKYVLKIFKGLAIQFVTSRWVYTLFYRAILFLKKDFDESLAGLTKGFPGIDVRQKIAFQPCTANLKLLQKRTSILLPATIEKRKEIALRLIKYIPDEMKIGTLNLAHTHWVLPIESQNPKQLIAIFREKGIDATSKASSLIKINDSAKQPQLKEVDLNNLVYLPIDERVIDQIQSIKLAGNLR